MYKILIACRAGIGSSLILKIKLNQIIEQNKLPVILEHASLDEVSSFHGDGIITLLDVANELKEKNPNLKVVGIKDVMNKDELFEKLKSLIE